MIQVRVNIKCRITTLEKIKTMATPLISNNLVSRKNPKMSAYTNNTTYTNKRMAKMRAVANLVAKITFAVATPRDGARTSAFVVAGAVVLEEAGGACSGELLEGLDLLKKGASSIGLAEEEGASDAARLTVMETEPRSVARALYQRCTPG